MPEGLPDESAPEPAGAPLFFESGASWLWVLAGPAAGLAMLGIQYSGGMIEPVVPLAFFVMVSGFVALQVKAARIHTSVELTPEHLRQGTQILEVGEILKVYPEPHEPPGRRHYDGRILSKRNALTNRAMRQAGVDLSDLEEPEPEPEQAPPDADAATVRKWQASRALGELTGVPRGRTGIGLKLVGGRTAQAWARNHSGLRAALTALVEARTDSDGAS